MMLSCTAIPNRVKKISEQAKQIRKLESELRRKEKALAEAAALLVLKKKPGKSGGSQRTTDPIVRSRPHCELNFDGSAY